MRAYVYKSYVRTSYEYTTYIWLIHNKQQQHPYGYMIKRAVAIFRDTQRPINQKHFFQNRNQNLTYFRTNITIMNIPTTNVDKNNKVRSSDSVSSIDSDRKAKKQKVASTSKRNFASLPKALQDQLNMFWKREEQIAKNLDPHDTDMFKCDAAPLARVKKIMRLDEKINLIGVEVPVLLRKACDMFMKDLTMRTWAHTEAKQRKTLGLGDLGDAMKEDEMFDFLIDFQPHVVTTSAASKKRTKSSPSSMNMTSSTTTTTTSTANTTKASGVFQKIPQQLSEDEMVAMFMAMQEKNHTHASSIMSPPMPSQ